MSDSATKPSNNDMIPVTTSEEKVPFFKKRAAKKNIRKRKTPVKVQSDSDDDEDDEDEEALVSEVVTKDRKTAKNPFVQSTRRTKRIKKTGDEDEEDEDDVSSLLGIQYTADRTAAVNKSDDATRYDTEWELQKTELDKSGKELPKKNAVNSKMSVGPQRAPANLRVTARFDYQPDICKDYKETGFCGYGDSCIFLHDRGDYKTGWQLEKEWEAAQKNKNRGGGADQYEISDEDDSDDEELPFACLICRNEFENPVVTKCNHYFCEACALKQYKKSPKCFACGAPTQGVFNIAKKLIERLEEKKQRVQGGDDGQASDAEEGSTAFIEGLETRSDDDED